MLVYRVYIGRHAGIRGTQGGMLGMYNRKATWEAYHRWYRREATWEAYTQVYTPREAIYPGI